MTVCLLSLGGLPPTAGFIGKWYIFSAAVSAGYYGLAIIGVLTSVVSVFFYLRVVVMMYMADRDAALAPARPDCRRSAWRRSSRRSSSIFYLGILPSRRSPSPPSRSRPFSDQPCEPRGHDTAKSRNPFVDSCPRDLRAFVVRHPSAVCQNDRAWPTHQQRRRARDRHARGGAEASRGGVQHVLRRAAAAPALGDARSRRGARQAARSHVHIANYGDPFPFHDAADAIREVRRISGIAGCVPREEGRRGSVRAAARDGARRA